MKFPPKKLPLQGWRRIQFLEKQLDEAIKVRNILIIARKVRSDDFQRAEEFVRALAPDKERP